MKTAPCLARGLVDLIVILPLFGTILWYFTLLATAHMSSSVAWYGITSVMGGVFLLACTFSGRKLAKASLSKSSTASPLPTSFSYRYQPVVLASVYTTLTALVCVFLPVPNDRAIFGNFAIAFFLTHPTTSAAPFLVQLFSPPSPWPFVLIPALIYGFYGTGMAWAYWRAGVAPIRLRIKVLALVFVLVAVSIFSLRAYSVQKDVLRGGWEHPFAERREQEKYVPFAEGNILAKSASPGLRIREDFPRLDGATAALPIYAAAAQAIFEPKADFEHLVTSTKTPNAYKQLFAGKVDVIFTAEPSKQQLADAAAAGIRLRMTPIAKDAFVFFVNSKNPVDGLTTEQIRKIYGKDILNWSEIGGTNRKILPFQRPEGSGSQTALEQTVMKGSPLAPALREEVVISMGGVVQRVASYQNSDGALGYSFRYFVTAMHKLDGIKLLSVDGIAPTPETIRSGQYPYTVDLYAITAGTSNPNVEKFVNWFKTPEGRKLIEDTGYVSSQSALPGGQPDL